MPGPTDLRALPAVHDLISKVSDGLPGVPASLLTQLVRETLSRARERIKSGGEAPLEDALLAEVQCCAAALAQASLRPVINATGVVLHTNLGRAPMPPFLPVLGYSNLEYDLTKGTRGKRDTHIAELLTRILGRPAIAVNNNAAAVFLALHELASGAEVIVSRGELIEIGDGFRIPDIMARSGAILREVGTTNRTRVSDYREAINDRTRLILRVHPSNFRIEGFTSRPGLAELTTLGGEYGIPVYEDIGSGCPLDLKPFGIDEPLPQDSLRNGVNLLSFSADKLMGGPQAGILAGDEGLIRRLRSNPMFRALRLDKLILQALETTLRHILFERWQSIPAIRMLMLEPAAIRRRSEELVSQLPAGVAEIVDGKSVIGGGSAPGQWLETCLIAIRQPDPIGTERRLRSGDPPVIARIENNTVMLDLRTVDPEEQPVLVRRLLAT